MYIDHGLVKAGNQLTTKILVETRLDNREDGGGDKLGATLCIPQIQAGQVHGKITNVGGSGKNSVSRKGVCLGVTFSARQNH